MAKVENVKALDDKLKERSKDADEANVSCVVGYTASYAVHVHENRAMKLKGQPRRGRHAKGLYWDPQGRAKAGFLLDPFRRMGSVLNSMIATALKAGKTMSQALLLAGLRLQRESQLECPVDKGNLKASAFTRLEK